MVIEISCCSVILTRKKYMVAVKIFRGWPLKLAMLRAHQLSQEIDGSVPRYTMGEKAGQFFFLKLYLLLFCDILKGLLLTKITNPNLATFLPLFSLF
mgnify:CR=1 FL=1